MPHRDAEAVLTDWHAVQRDLDEALFGSTEARRLHDEADRLQDEHAALAREARRRGLPAVASFPVPVEARCRSRREVYAADR